MHDAVSMLLDLHDRSKQLLKRHVSQDVRDSKAQALGIARHGKIAIDAWSEGCMFSVDRARKSRYVIT